MSGEIYALACAVLWAASSALIKSQTHKMHIVLLGALRTVPAVLIYWGVLLFSGKTDALFHLPLRTWAFLAGSSVIGLVVGDLLYFWSMKLIGLSRAMPLSTTYPFFTLVLALLFLDEPLSWAVVIGALFIVGGAYLLAFPRMRGRATGVSARDELNLGGVALALVAAMCWASSTVMLRVGLEGVDVAVANALRLSVLLVVLMGLLLGQRGSGRIEFGGLRSLGIVLLAGVVGTGLGTYTFLTAVQRAGAARTSILTATTPLFGVPLSLLLREKLSSRTVVGTALTVVGVWFTVY